jgi:primosomal protein N' (replication factor Y)
VVLASATPSLETMREAELGRHTLLRLPERIEDRPLPPVQVVDLRRQTPKAQILSHPLREGIAKRLARGEQSILFLNRRGYAHTLLCRACGFQEMCPSCAVTLAFHMGERLLRCHHCDYQRTPDAACPLCKGTRIAYKGVGTERLEEEVHALWPEARIARMDRDTTARKGAHREILDAFAHEEMDILIGTQMVAKGLDFPKVTLVGVIAADTSLGIPDFRAPERTFQLLTQVAGRAGRAEWAGEVVVQTFRPEHYAVQAAALHDYDSFYAQEIRARGDSAACWPPLTGLINIVVSGERETEVKAMAAALARRAAGVPSITLPPVPTHAVLPGLLELIRVDDDTADAPEDDPYDAEALLARAVPSGVTVEGPAPCALARLQNRWRYHVLLRGRDAAALRRVARDLMALDPPPGVHVVVDVEPQGLA